MTQPVKFLTVTPLGNAVEMKLKRWFQTREFWTGAATVTLAVVPAALDMIGTIGLTPTQLLIWTIGLIGVRETIGVYLKNTSTSLVVSKDQLAQEATAIQANADGPVAGSMVAPNPPDAPVAPKYKAW